MAVRLTAREYGFLGACERFPECVLDADGEWSDKAVDQLERIANKLLGIRRGRSPRGLRQHAPKQEVLSSSIVEDLAGSQRGWMYQQR
jgi:hypothetical protein